MRQFYRLSIILLFVINLLHANEKGTLTVASEPEQCWVRIDSVLVGKTPLRNLELPVGEHIVIVYPPQNGLWNIEEKTYNISISNDSPTDLNAVFRNPVFINTMPYGATLFSDTTNFGNTPLYLSFEENRGKSFRLIKNGYKPYEFRLTSPASILAELEQDANYRKETPKPQLLGLIRRSHLKSKFTLLAASVASSWASFILKNKANKNFDKYEASSDPVQIDKFWNNTKKYDRLSDITLGISYASLAGLIYMVIWK